jgi:hypothetical protein
MHGAVLLGEQPPQRGLTIYVPSGYERPVVGVCHVCGAEFGEGQEEVWQRHVGACARAHIDEIRASTPSARNRGGPFDPETFDPEVDAHMAEVGRRMRAEGRLEVLPSERAGFS